MPVSRPSAYLSYTDVQEQGRELLRQNMVDAASHLLTTEGAGALTVRRIADELGCSTKVIYTTFGGKDGLANELYIEGCERLRACIEGVPAQDEVTEYLRANCWAYWEFAHANASYYGVMFGSAIPHFQPDKQVLASVGTAFNMLLAALIGYQAQSKMPVEDVEALLKFIWSPLHGVISLHQAGHFPEDMAKSLYQRVIEAVIASLLGS